MIYRQGDVLMIAVRTIPEEATETEIKGDLILMHGEATGHAHRIALQQDKVRVFDRGAERFIHAIVEAPITHEEHGTIIIPPGIYRQAFQVEERGKEIRRVED